MHYQKVIDNMTKKQEEAIKSLPQTGFQFSEEAHLYVLDGKPLTGVTTILGVIAKPALIQWSAGMAADYASALIKADTKYTEDQLVEIFKEAKVAHRKKKEAAGNTGTKVHDWIERYIKAKIAGIELPAFEEDIKHITDQFVVWATENNITFLVSEKRLFSKEYWYAGTVDLVFLKDGKKYVGDIKTSSGIYGREFFFQCAGYQIALEEQGEKDIFGSTIIRCGKDGSFEIKDSFDIESDKAGFLAALRLYRELEK